MKIGNSMVVSLEYTLKDEEGEVIDTNVGGDPLVYLHGTGSLIEGFEDGLDEMGAGEDYEITVEPKFGYGEIKQSMIKTMKRDQFPPEQELEIGQVFNANSPEGPSQIKIIEIDGETIKVDGNHELAGKTLFFSGKILEVREATDDELGHGHVHGPGCDH